MAGHSSCDKTIPTFPPGQFFSNSLNQLFLEKLQRPKRSSLLSVNAAEKKKPRTPVRRAKPVPDVPECLTLSSDEEDSAVDHGDDFLDNPCGDLEVGEMDGHDSADEQRCFSGIEGGGLLQQASDGSLSGPLIQLLCRSVRIGSYKVKPLQRVLLAEPGIEIVVPNPNKVSDEEGIKVFINMQDIRRILLCSDRTMPALFIHVKNSAAARIRELLNMTDPSSDRYFNPESKEEMYKRITLLPEKYNDEYKMNIQKIVPPHLLANIAYTQANEILLKACPKEMQAQIRKNAPPSVKKIQTIMVYPPPPAKGGIPINTEDYACLGEDVFLNDVIIDFYLKYLMLAVLSPEDRERTHVFSTFFYKRLTSPPGKSMRASHPVESNPNLSPAEKRHSRVKSWTKNINLFTKDFIIIPINEKCHWFLAIICFPGQDGCLRMSDNAPLSPPATPPSSASSAAAAAAAATAAAVAAASGSSKIKVNSNNVLSIGSTTITPVKTTSDTITLDCNNGEEGSDRDEAEGDEDEMDDPASDDEESAAMPATEESTSVAENPIKTETAEDVAKVAEKPKNNRMKFHGDAIKQPCILIFDSLMGAPRSRVVATLRDYLRIEHKVKEGREKDFNKDTIKGMMPKVPQQKNFTDCGLYLLQYAEQFFKDPIKDYHPPIKTLKDWFPADVVRRKRQEIQLLLHQLMEEQKIDVSKLNLPHLTFSSQRSSDDADGNDGPGECAEGGETHPAEAGEDDAEAAAAEAAAAEAAAAQIAADHAEAELAWGPTGAEEEVTTDGIPPADDLPCDYDQMEVEEELEEEEPLEHHVEEDVQMYEDDHHLQQCEELEEAHEAREDEGVCQVIENALLNTTRLVNYPDSDDGWSPNNSPSPSPASFPSGVTITPSSDSVKRTFRLSVRPVADIKRMKFSDR